LTVAELIKTLLPDGRIKWTCPVCRGGQIAAGEQVMKHRCKKTGEVLTYVPEGEAPVAPVPAPTMPSLPRRARNLTRAYRAHKKAGKPRASDEDVAARWAICQACVGPGGYFKPTGEGMGKCTHKECGCNLRAVGSESVRTPNKLRWADQACPIGRWAPVSPAPLDAPPSLPGGGEQ
jgi:hypothetical protein